MKLSTSIPAVLLLIAPLTAAFPAFSEPFALEKRGGNSKDYSQICKDEKAKVEKDIEYTQKQIDDDDKIIKKGHGKDYEKAKKDIADKKKYLESCQKQLKDLKTYNSKHIKSLPKVPAKNTGGPWNCAKWVPVQSGDSCKNLARKNGCSLDDFKSWNPNQKCPNMSVGYNVCVKVQDDIPEPPEPTYPHWIKAHEPPKDWPKPQPCPSKHDEDDDGDDGDSGGGDYSGHWSDGNGHW